MIFVHLTTGTGHFWRTICDVADKEGERGQKALDELIAAIPAIATMQEHEVRPLIERIADGYQEPPEGDPLSPPVGLSAEALDLLEKALLLFLDFPASSYYQMTLGSMVQPGPGEQPSPALPELTARLSLSQWNSERDRAIAVCRAVLLLNGRTVPEPAPPPAPREEVLAEVKVPAGENLSDLVAKLLAKASLGPDDPAVGLENGRLVALRPIAKGERVSLRYDAFDAMAKLTEVRSRIAEQAKALKAKLEIFEFDTTAKQNATPEPAPSSDLLRAVDALRVGFTVQIVEDPHIEGNWLVNLHPRAPGPTLGFSSALLGQALLKAVDGGRQLLEQQSQKITRALDAIRGAQ